MIWPIIYIQNLILFQFNFKLVARVTKFFLQSHSINSNSAHPQVDIHNHIWENEIPFSDSSDAFILLIDGVILAIVSCFGLHSSPLENFNCSFLTLIRKELLNMHVI